MPPRSDAHLDDPVLLGFPLKSGFRIVPPTIIIEQLGEGASAIVYRARHYNLDTDVAVKILRKDVAANNPDLVARFQREAKLAAQIRQENLLAVLDTTDHNGTHYTI
ncbi:MAG: protein kinase, partial [Planctomycetota bacterium]